MPDAVPRLVGTVSSRRRARRRCRPRASRTRSTPRRARLVARASSSTGAGAVVRVGAPCADEARRSPRHGPDRIPGPALRSGGDRTPPKQGVVAFAMESIPRITRAQAMDALSSQATVAGYKAALLAADRLPKMFPLLMTAAGTIAPAKVLVSAPASPGSRRSRRRGGSAPSFRPSTCGRPSRSRWRASAPRSSTRRPRRGDGAATRGADARGAGAAAGGARASGSRRSTS